MPYIYADCLDVALPGLLVVFGRHVLDDESNSTVDYSVQEAVRMYGAAMETAEKKENVSMDFAIVAPSNSNIPITHCSVL